MLFAAYGGHTTSNPKYIAAVKRQKQKELERSPEYQAKLQAQTDMAREKAIAELRADQNTRELVSMFKTIDVMRVQEPPAPIMTGRITAECIIRAGVAGTPFTAEDIKGPRRTRRLVEIRHQLIAKVYVECPWLSLPQIGKAFGGRDHTSAHFAVKKMGVHHTQPGGARKDDFARAA